MCIIEKTCVVLVGERRKLLASAFRFLSANEGMPGWGPMVKADKDDVRVENTRLRALVRELRDEIEQLMQANQVEITNLKTEIEHTSKIVSSKRYISSPVDVARKKLKKEKEKFFGDKIFLRLMPATPSESNPKNYKSLCPSFDVQNTLEIHNEIFQGKNCGELTGAILKPSLQVMERIQVDVLAENACLSALVEELRDKICQLTEVTFAEIFKLTGELGSFWKFSESKGLVLWNEDEVRAKLRKEKAKVFCNLPNLSLSKGPHGGAKLNFLDCLRRKITRTCMSSENIYEVDNVFQIKPEMLADEFPPYWYFFTRPGGSFNQDDPFNKALISGIWRQQGRVQKVFGSYSTIAKKRTYVCGNWRLILYRLQLSMEVDASKGYETGWAFAHMKNGNFDY